MNDVVPEAVLYGICKFAPPAIFVAVVADVAVAALPLVFTLIVEGRLKVMLPDPFVTDTWLAVPVIVDLVKFVPLPISI